jgi:rhamnose transport system ATP-binding protein
VIGRLRQEGAGIIYISHRLEEVFAIADRITVLRDGETVRTARREDITREEIVRAMAGRRMAAAASAPAASAGPVALEVRGLSARVTGLQEISLSLRRGEILGLAGLVGSGRTELAETLFGLHPIDTGEILVDGQPATIRDPRDAIRQGLAYLPEDRRRHGVLLDMSVAANTSLASLDAVTRHGLVRPDAERVLADRFVAELRIKTSAVDADVSTLSGGNQQKVALARWLATNPSVLLLDEPTQGVDVAAKAEIHAQIRAQAARGLAILLISSELPEILAMSDRVAVMAGGRLRAIFDRAEATAERVLALALAPEPAPAVHA